MDCGVPSSASGVIVDPYENIIEGSIITYHCDDGLVPNRTITATCMSNGQWHPNPISHTCQLPSAGDVTYLYHVSHLHLITESYLFQLIVEIQVHPLMALFHYIKAQ